MYQTHFGISENPFSITPDPRFLYMSPRYQEALAHLLYGISESGGFVLLTGEVGTGKTTTCRCLLEQLPDDVNVALVLNPKLSELELLSTICDELSVGAPEDRTSLKAYYDLLNQHLLNAHAEGRRSVLIIDEAQNLAPEVVEQVRLLTNLETATTKLLQIILVGQPELNDLLSKPSMRQVAQRITARFHLNELELEETRSYVAHRLQVSGLSEEVFTPRSIEVVHRYSRGIPRLVNSICDRCLLGAYTQNSRVVDHHLAILAASEVLGTDAVPEAGRAAEAVKRNKMEPDKAEPETQASEPSTAMSDTKSSLSFGGLVLAFALAIVAGGALALFDPLNLKLIPEETRVEALAKIYTAMGQESGETTPPAGKDKQTAAVTSEQPADPSDQLNTAAKKTTPSSDPFTAKPGSRRAALGELLKAWNVTLSNNAGPDLCNTAPDHGLKCFEAKGSFRAIENLNRPVIITLSRDFDGLPENQTPANEPVHAVVTGFDDQMVTLALGDETVTVTRRSVMPHWDRSFLTLWQPPPFYTRNLDIGMEGQDVAWVKVRLTGLRGKTPVARTVATFDTELVEQITAFQKENGLPVTGVIGAETLMKLRDMTENRDIPTLSRSSAMVAPIQAAIQGAN